MAGDVHVVRGESDRTEYNWPEGKKIFLLSMRNFTLLIQSIFCQTKVLNKFSEKVVTIGQLRIGIIHGHQLTPWGDQNALEAVQRSLNVDILIHGHTYKYKVDRNY